MKDRFEKSSPYFFRLIIRSMLLFGAGLLVLAAVLPAPLQTAADPSQTPNPVKSAWFLLWIQELVSWSRHMIWCVVAIGLLAVLLPWLPGIPRLYRARWFSKEQIWPNLTVLALFLVIVALTGVALFLRGPNWSLAF